MIASIIYALGGFRETLIGLRFVLRLLGANPDNGLVQLVYNWSKPFVAPFSGIFGQDASVVHGAGVVTISVFDWTALVAFVVIGFIVALIGNLVARRHY